MQHPWQRRQDTLVTASFSGSNMEGVFFSIVVDSCPENHLLVETNVLLTREKCFQIENRIKDLMKRLCSHIEECNGNLGEGACRGRMALQFRLCS